MVDWPLSATHLYDVILISIAMFPHWLCFIGYQKKKNLTCGGYDGPRAFYKKKDDLLTQIEKTPEPPPPSWRSGIRCPVRTGPGRSSLWLMGTGEGIFFTPSLKFAPTGSRTQTWGVPPEFPNQRVLFTLLVIKWSYLIAGSYLYWDVFWTIP
jgi:hypothetical protein